jgi:hypothetical protein
MYTCMVVKQVASSQLSTYSKPYEDTTKVKLYLHCPASAKGERLYSS